MAQIEILHFGANDRDRAMNNNNVPETARRFTTSVRKVGHHVRSSFDVRVCVCVGGL